MIRFVPVSLAENARADLAGAREGRLAAALGTRLQGWLGVVPGAREQRLSPNQVRGCGVRETCLLKVGPLCGGKEVNLDRRSERGNSIGEG